MLQTVSSTCFLHIQQSLGPWVQQTWPSGMEKGDVGNGLRARFTVMLNLFLLQRVIYFLQKIHFLRVYNYTMCLCLDYNQGLGLVGCDKAEIYNELI